MKLQLPQFLCAILLASSTTISTAASVIDDLNNAIQAASPGDSISWNLSEDILLTPFQTQGDPYAAREWGSIINKGDITLTLSGLRADGSKTSFTGGGREIRENLTRAILNLPGGNMKLEHLQFNSCHYFRMGATAPTGGAISNFGGNMEVWHSDFTGNSIQSYDRYAGGGAISSSYSVQWEEKKPSSILLAGCTFTGNYATTSPETNHSVQGGAFLNGGAARVSQCVFRNNYTLTDIMNPGKNTSGGGAIANNGGKLLIEDSTFIGNRVISTGGAFIYGGAVWDISTPSTDTGLTVRNSLFEGNFCQSSGRTGGGAIFIHLAAISTIIDSSFTNNFNASPTYYGGAIHTSGPMNLIAETKDVVFQGNKHYVTQVDENGKALDGISNAITTSGAGFLNLVAGNNKKIVFHDSILAAVNDTSLNINPDQIAIDNKTGELIDNPYAHDGEVVFMEGTTSNNFRINLDNGSLRLGNNTSIKGTINARTGTSLMIDGFTTLARGEALNPITGVSSPGTMGAYNVSGTGGEHTIRIQMNDSMVAATNENPVWTFANDSSLNADPGALVFVLDIKNINTRPEELHPFIFSHTMSSEATKASVAGAKHVYLTDSDGWIFEYSPYTVDGRTYDKFDFLSGQYGVPIPGITIPEVPIPEGKAPTDVGSAQVNTLWTTVKSLWSLSDAARSNTRYPLNLERSIAFWASGIGDYYTQENQSVSSGYRYRSLGYAAGGEYAFVNNWTLGAALGSLRADHDVGDRSGRIDKDTNIGLLYSTYTLDLDKKNTLLLDFQAGYAHSDNKGSVAMKPIYSDSLSGKWTDKAWILDLKGIWLHGLEKGWTLETFTGLQYTQASQNDFSITGDKYQYRLTDGDMYELRAMVGSGVRYQGSLASRAFNAYVKSGLIQDISREAPHVNVGGINRSWTAGGSKPGRTSINVASGVRMQISGGWSVAADYSIEAATKSLMQSGRISVICEF